MRIPSAVRQLHRAALKQGWVVELAGNGHLRWLPPDGGAPVYCAASTKDPREGKNTRAKLRRAGLKI